MKATMVWRCHACGDLVKDYLLVVIIMASVIPPDHVDDLPVVEPNQPDVVHVIPEPVLVDTLLVDEDGTRKRKNLREEKNLKRRDMDIDDEEYENKPEWIEVEALVLSVRVETVPSSVHEIASLSRRLCGRETTHALVEKKGKEKDKYYDKLTQDSRNTYFTL
ncbi:hypothetical protein Tco_0525557 [Tanacetum coccineum]